MNTQPKQSQWKSDAAKLDSVQSTEAHRPNVFGQPENQYGGHINLSGCYDWWNEAIDEGVVRQLSIQWVHISKIDP